MVYIKPFLSILVLSIFATSCSKKADSNNASSFKEDPNNFFTATFNGKTIKTSGFILTTNGVVDNLSASATALNATVLTSNSGSTSTSSGSLYVMGSVLNLSFTSTFNLPSQQLDATINIERVGNAVGTYRITDPGQGLYYTSSINDLTVGNKKYDVDPVNTTLTISSADALYIQGTYTGRLIDGATRIPVTGSFKLRKF